MIGFRRLLDLLFIIAISGVGCSNVVRSSDLGTATAQAGKVVALATQMSYQAMSTLEAGTRLATATAQARQSSLSTAKGWLPVLSDSFSSDMDVWAVGEESDDSLGSVQWSIDGGKYRWQAQAISGFVWWVVPEGEPVSDFYLTVDAQQTGDADVGEYGVVFRQDENEQYYLFEISDLGLYALFMYTLNGWETLIDWTTHDAISPGEVNQLEVLALGTQFALYINDEYVDGYVDDRLPSGRTGLLVGLSNAGEESSWIFDDFEVRAP